VTPVSIQDETEREIKTQESVHWLNQTSTYNRNTTLLEEEREDRHKSGPEKTPNPPPIYIIDVKNILPLIQLYE
jgi:hypothetical protein